MLDARPAGPIVTALYRAVEAGDWLTDADRAGIEALYLLAEVLDAPVGLDVDTLGMLVSRFLRGCDQYGLSPFGRGRIETPEGGEDEELAAVLRLARGD